MTMLLDPPAVDEGPVANITRRDLIAAAAAITLVGCGESSGGGENAPRRVQTGRGPVDVPVRPQRIACADFYGSFQVVDLGLKPVGLSGGAGSFEPYSSRLKGVEKVGDYTEPDVERIAAVRPDLILRTIDTQDQLYKQLSRIAPTVEISFQKLSLTEVTSRVGKALNRERQARALNERFERRAAGIRRAYGDVLRRTRWSMVNPAEPGQFFLLSPAWTDMAVLIEAGVRPARPGSEQQEPAKSYSLERLSMVADSDVIVIPSTEDGKPDPTMDDIRASSVWKGLPAVQQGRVYALPSGTSSLGMAFPLLDRLEDALARLV